MFRYRGNQLKESQTMCFVTVVTNQDRHKLCVPLLSLPTKKETKYVFCYDG